MTQLPSWSDGLLGFSCPNLLLVFLNLIFLGTSVSYFFPSVGTFSGSFLFIFSVLYFRTTAIRLFALKSKKDNILDRGQNGF